MHGTKSQAVRAALQLDSHQSVKFGRCSNKLQELAHAKGLCPAEGSIAQTPQPVFHVYTLAHV